MRPIRILLVAAVASVGVLLASCSSPTGPAKTPHACETVPWTC